MAVEENYLKLKTQPQAGCERSTAGQIRMEVQGVEPIIGVGKIQQAQANLGIAPRKSITRKDIMLPKVGIL